MELLCLCLHLPNVLLLNKFSNHLKGRVGQANIPEAVERHSGKEVRYVRCGGVGMLSLESGEVASFQGFPQ